jgi:serpin B
MIKKVILLSMLSILVLIVTSCTQSQEKDISKDYSFAASEITDLTFDKDLVSSINKTGYNAFKEIHKTVPTENIVFSPLSLTTALSMLEEGAASETKKEIRDVLNISEEAELSKLFNQIITHFDKVTKIGNKENSKNISLKLANSIWFRKKNLSVNEDYISTIKTLYNGDLFSVDFSSSDTKDLMNHWIDENTNHLLEGTIKKTRADNIAYLINTIYFKGEWIDPFNENLTKKKTFITDQNDSLDVDMMYKKDSMKYYEDNYLQMVALKYPQSTLYIFLPKDNLESMLDNIDYTSLNKRVESSNYSSVELSLPKFNYKNNTNLKDLLIELGMPSAFNASNADFSKMIDSNTDIYVSNAFQNATIALDEKGTEAAAVTVIEMTESAAPDIEEAKIMNCNKPFLFLLKENNNKSDLFIGVVNNPNE